MNRFEKGLAALGTLAASACVDIDAHGPHHPAPEAEFANMHIVGAENCTKYWNTTGRQVAQGGLQVSTQVPGGFMPRAEQDGQILHIPVRIQRPNGETPGDAAVANLVDDYGGKILFLATDAAPLADSGHASPRKMTADPIEGFVGLSTEYKVGVPVCLQAMTQECARQAPVLGDRCWTVTRENGVHVPRPVRD